MSTKRATKSPAKKGTRNAETKALLAEVALGEDSTRQFKRDVTNGDALAAELVAFANAEGGRSTSESLTTARHPASPATT